MSILFIYDQRPDGWTERELVEKLSAYGRGDQVEFSDFDFKAMAVDRVYNDLWLKKMGEQMKVDPLILTLGREEGEKARAEIGVPWVVPG